MRWVGSPVGVLPPPGRVENAKRRQQARRAKRQKQADQPPVATRSSRCCSTRARTSHTTRAPRESRAAAHGTPASGKRSSRNPPLQQQARPLLGGGLACCVHVQRSVRSGGARRLGVLRACASLSIHVRPGAGEANEAQGPPTHIATRVRACVRTYLREVAPTCAMYPASLVLVRLV